MSCFVAYYFAALAVILMHDLIFQVKGQPTENGDSLIGIASEIRELRDEIFQSIRELYTESIQQMKNKQDTNLRSPPAAERCSQEQDIYIKQVQSIYKFLNASFQQMKNRQDTVMRSLQAVDRRLNEHDASIKNEIQNSWKLAIGVPALVEIGVDLGESSVPLPTINNWIIIMQRFDESFNFNRNWTEYRNGFGDIGRGDFWLGNEKVHRLTNRIGVVYMLRIEVYINGTWFNADYATFSLDSERDKYTLRVSGFSGNGGDSLTNTSLNIRGYLGGMSFTTWDDDNDRYTEGNCARLYPAGWWFNDCFYHACLTCQYNNNFRWDTLRHLASSGIGRLGAARMMIKSI